MSTVIDDTLEKMYHLWVKHGQQVWSMLSIDTVCSYLETLTTDIKWLTRLSLALEEVTVDDEDESTQDQFDRQEAENGQY